jgi:predicted short-subunit dehydrogenase-like oxidoreductase (DUF2520 family)
MTMSERTVAIIGAGRVGTAVGRLLARAGWQVAGVVSRSMATARAAAQFIGAGTPMIDAPLAAASADLIFITTPDGSIRNVCKEIAGNIRKKSIVLHMSGAHTLDLLDAARQAGAYRAVVHPLQSIPSAEQGTKNVPGSYFRIEADPEAGAMARELVQALGGKELALPRWRSDNTSASLYHAGAVAVSNYFVAVIEYGLRFYQVLGANKQEALRAVLPLIKGTLGNIEKLGTTQALTGPIARGDAATVQEHLKAMRERAPGLEPLYRELAKQTIAIARERGLPETQVLELLKLLQE